MPRPDDLARHFWLTQGMARTLGIRVTDALHDGRLSAEAFDALVATCCACRRSDRCMGWMARPRAADAPPPAYCQIAAPLRQLGPQQAG